MHRGLQGPGHLHHLPGGLHHAAALLAHMHGDGDALPRQRGQGPDQLIGGIEALRRVAQSQGHAQGPVGQSPLQPPVNGGVVLRLQALHLIPGHAGPDGSGSRQHPRVQRGGGLGGEILRQGLPGRLRRHPAADGLQIRGDGRQVLRPHRGAGQAAVAVDDGGESLPQLQLPEARPEGRGIGVAVDVDKARGHPPAPGVDDPGGLGLGQRLHRGDFAAGHRHVGPTGGTACAVVHGAAPDDEIKHGISFF